MPTLSLALGDRARRRADNLFGFCCNSPIRLSIGVQTAGRFCADRVEEVVACQSLTLG